MYRLGVVSFLNARPLIEGLDQARGISLLFDVPSRLESLLAAGAVDAALLPIVDVLRGGGRYLPLSDAAIASDGETMTVRVFSQTPPHLIDELHADADSHTSVALARVLWREIHGRQLRVHPLEAGLAAADDHRAILLIGDKVVNPGRGSFAYEVDLGGAWRQHTGLPFVFALWAIRSDRSWTVARRDELDALLRAARDNGVQAAGRIARTQAPCMGWPVPLAERYLTRCLQFTLTPRHIAGAQHFAALCAAHGVIERPAAIDWALVHLEQVAHP